MPLRLGTGGGTIGHASVRQALSVLREQGVIVTSQGIGSFVAER